MTIHGLVYDNGLVEETGIDEGTVAQWENITSRHVMSYWNSVDKAGIEVYGVNTTLIVAKREANQRTMVPKERLLQVTDDLLPPNVTIPIDSSSPNITPGPTISPSLQGNWSGNETAFPVNISSAPNGMPSFSPTANPTTSYQPSISAGRSGE